MVTGCSFCSFLECYCEGWEPLNDKIYYINNIICTKDFNYNSVNGILGTRFQCFN